MPNAHGFDYYFGALGANDNGVVTLHENDEEIRSQRWRYIRYSDETEELYDHENDPWEHDNLAADETYNEVMAEHRSWLPKKETPFTAEGRQSWDFGPWDK